MTTDSDEAYREEPALSAGTEGAPDVDDALGDRRIGTEADWAFETPANARIGAMDTETDSDRGIDTQTWDFAVIRIIRVIVGIAVLFALLFDVQGTFQRVVANPALGIVALAAVLQVVAVEDIERLRELLP